MPSVGLTLVRQRSRMDQHEPTPLTVTQRLALTAIVDEGPLRLGELAERMGAMEPTATRTVDSLASAGLVRRAPHPDDRRGVLIDATKRGTRILARRRHRLLELIESGLAEVPDDDRERLADLLDELSALLAPEVLEAAPTAVRR
ncbi:MAG: MarR family transcriptional regulator [Actinomycetota bacterium]